MAEVNDEPTTSPPDARAQFLPPAEDIVAIIERQPGETLEAAREDLARMLQLTGQVNTLIDELALAAASSATSTLEKAHLQLALLVEFAERCAGGAVAAHQPLRELLVELEQRLKAGA